ncbi:type I secretion system permease/ATPase [Scleromatobacter humisilvae]|uniref:Cyclolysin secretion/processing ATP-binding protein CyaB n=1 Tax=Scleromatobacter humisilvae TaxID=2897159 RepID=A0A9X1YHI7_9BURK|nr:type I secretion system permease/ATPase [Scleromatobacter humisilvae]MCK9686589.1 type I secretion system permease/ATPase [Scleromatobacter humisilvae]
MSDRQDPFLDFESGSPREGGGVPAGARPNLQEEGAVDAIPELDAIGVDHDALLHSMVYLTRHHGKERSADSLLDGMPIDGLLNPDQAVRVMRAAGYNAGLMQRDIGDIHALLLPAILLLKNGDACVLARRLDTPRGQSPVCEIVMPGQEFHTCQATEAELEQEYLGFALVATPLPELAHGQAGREQALLNPNGHWLWGTLRRFIPYYRSAMIAALLSNVLMLVTGLVTSVIYDKVIPHQGFVTLWALAAGSLIALIFDLVSRQLRSHLIDTAGKKADLIIGSLLFRQTLGVRMEHRPESAGNYAHHIAQIEIVREFFAGATLSAVSDVPFIAMYVAMTFVIGGPLGWVLVMAIPMLITLALTVQSRLRRAMRASLAHQADLQGVIVEAVEGLEDLKAVGAQGRFLHRFENANAAAAEAGLMSRWMMGWTNNISSVSQQLITLVMLVWGVYLIHDGVVTGGALIGAVMYAGRAVMPVNSVVSLASRYQGARAAMVSLDKMMAEPSERENGRAYVTGHRVTGQIGLNDLSFAYPQTTDAAAPRVLKNVTVKVNAGERIAILGRIGSGKSTILRLMAGLYQPSEGFVDVDGLDLRQIDPADYRMRVGFVSQEPRLFKGTLRDNVMMGRPQLDAAKLAEVAKVTGLDRVVAGHPQGWELSVGEMGGLLSGGQRQLVALARCLITKPQILLMDEPTSSMDAQSEVMFLRQLKEAAGTRTLIMVTHRPAVLELVDRVMVVDGGKVVLDGPKAAVLAALSGIKPPGQQQLPQQRPSAEQPVQRQPAPPAMERAQAA